jgi:hypothetical protein
MTDRNGVHDAVATPSAESGARRSSNGSTTPAVHITLLTAFCLKL